MKRLIMFAILVSLFVMAGVVSAQEVNDQVDVTIGDLPVGQQVTITYEVTVGELDQGILFIRNQGVVSGSNFDDMLSDDPMTATEIDDTTDTPVAFNLDVVQLPDTGQTPSWAIMLISLIAAVVVTGAAGAVWYQRQSASA